jgi:hypothetical protein
MADLAASVAHARGVSVHEMLKQTKGSLPLTQLVHALVKDHKQSPARVDQKWGLPHGTAARLLREPDPRPDAPVLRLVPPAPESEAPRRYMSEEHKEKIRQAHLRNNARVAQLEAVLRRGVEVLRHVDWEQIKRDKKLCSP